MRIDILTLFPGMFDGPLRESIVKRAIISGVLDVHVRNIRDHATDRHHTADDYPFGGGAGMVLKPEPIFGASELAVAEARASGQQAEPRVILTAAQGRQFTQTIAEELSQLPHLIFICGHYEGVDERVREHLANDEISIGDYVLTGGELPAMVILDAVVRLLPGALGANESLAEESYSGGLLEYPQYTRPPLFRGWNVPDVLLSGNHERIARWRREHSLLRTLERRPDLLDRAHLSPDDRLFLAASGASEYLNDEAKALLERRARRAEKKARRANQ
jgi:tRNA (guanine37-N1)-methyltransferase